jgi:hypothetical protein
LAIFLMDKEAKLDLRDERGMTPKMIVVERKN